MYEFFLFSKQLINECKNNTCSKYKYILKEFALTLNKMLLLFLFLYQTLFNIEYNY